MFTLSGQFNAQARDARLIRNNPNGLLLYRQKKSLDINRSIRNRDYDSVLNNFVRTEDMNYLQDKAYTRKEGYAIGYVNGKKVMYVSGSRNAVDWAFNVGDDFIPAKHHIVSNKTAKNLTKIAQEEHVDLVVGHSRGAMLVAKMDIPEDKKLGLDGAMRLAPKNKRGMMNLYQKQTLDKFISRRGSNRKGYRLKRVKQYHFISRDYKGYKGPQYAPKKKRFRWSKQRYYDARKGGRW